jgi:hypothetical protein
MGLCIPWWWRTHGGFGIPVFGLVRTEGFVGNGEDISSIICGSSIWTFCVGGLGVFIDLVP